jgi:hypothetical protein
LVGRGQTSGDGRDGHRIDLFGLKVLMKEENLKQKNAYSKLGVRLSQMPTNENRKLESMAFACHILLPRSAVAIASLEGRRTPDKADLLN